MPHMSATQQSTRALQHGRITSPASSGFARSRPIVLSAAKLLMLGIANLPFLRAAPLGFLPSSNFVKADDAMPPDDAKLWIYLAVALGLVLLGGAFAGLTIALMGQDEIYLQVVRTSGEGSEKKHAASVLRLLRRGKHWVLVTLLLGNVITNETLPVVLDRSLGGGWQAVLGSTVLIVIFGEIIPQSICVRYGLPIGAWMSPLVLVLMYILGPVAWPTAKLLDKLLGEDHGTTYKKAGLKTLVTLHKSLGDDGEQLNQDEVTIISAVLDLKAKTVGSIMTPMEDVFTMSADTVLNEETMDVILGAGYSRIPIYEPGNEQNFVGMLLVKILITYDPEDGKRVRDFALATLPETRAETSCLDIVNFFQEGKSHMVLVSEFPGDDHGALGVVTLEDVIEELIGEEIIDESDVYIDVHKAIRRMHPAPRSRVPRGEVVAPGNALAPDEENLIDLDSQKAQHHGLRRTATSDTVKANGINPELSSSPKKPLHLRRPSSATGNSDQSVPKRVTDRNRLKHLGPSNLASRPRQTRYNTVKIKPGGGSFSDVSKLQESTETPRSLSMSTAPQGGVGAGLLQSAGKDAKDGVLAVQAGYGTINSTSPDSKRLQTPNKGDRSAPDFEHSESPSKTNLNSNEATPTNKSRPPPRSSTSKPTSQSTLGSLGSPQPSPTRGARSKRSVARSGSITENIIDRDGIKKVVLETTSSSDDSGSGGGARVDGSAAATAGAEEDKKGEDGEAREENRKPGSSSADRNGEEGGSSGAGGKKKRRRRKRGKTGPGRGSEEERELLEREGEE